MRDLSDGEKRELTSFFRKHEHEHICVIANIHTLVDALDKDKTPVTMDNLEYIYGEPDVKERLVFEPEQTTEPVNTPPPALTAESIRRLPVEQLRAMVKQPAVLAKLNETLKGATK